LPPEDREILEVSALAVDEVPVLALQAPRIAAR
jgi:hypothetical protein